MACRPVRPFCLSNIQGWSGESDRILSENGQGEQYAACPMKGLATKSKCQELCFTNVAPLPLLQIPANPFQPLFNLVCVEGIGEPHAVRSAEPFAQISNNLMLVVHIPNKIPGPVYFRQDIE